MSVVGVCFYAAKAVFSSVMGIDLANLFFKRLRYNIAIMIRLKSTKTTNKAITITYSVLQGSGRITEFCSKTPVMGM